MCIGCTVTLRSQTRARGSGGMLPKENFDKSGAIWCNLGVPKYSRSRRDVMSHVIYLTTRPPLLFGGRSSDKLNMKRNK